MASIKTNCPFCSKVFVSLGEFIVAGRKVFLGECGHIVSVEQLGISDLDAVISLTGKKPFPFQKDGVKFVEDSAGRCLIADEMGLGKTTQALVSLSVHKDKMLPAIYIVKSALKRQWSREHMDWLGENSFCQMIDSTRDIFLPGCDAYIISYDLLWRLGLEKMETFIVDRKIKTIILDECQQIKNIESKRTIMVSKLCAKIEHVIALSGTPIKNKIEEYFPILNILKPQMFPTFGRFSQQWLGSYWDSMRGKYITGGLAYPEQFITRTKDFIIRRERKEVMSQLPEVFRQFTFHDLSKDVEEAYKKAMEEFMEEYDSQDPSEMNLLAYMTKMRQLTGISKVDPTIDAVMELLGSSERKICIFVHHINVAYLLETKLNSLLVELGLAKCINLVQMDSAAKDTRLGEFIKDPRKRISIFSTLSSGEGMDGLQKIDAKCIILERQWNPANEEQVEGRFTRIGSVRSEVDALYPVAVGTIDEFFSVLVEKKRAIINSAMKGVFDSSWDEKGLMKELAETLANSGRKAYKLS